MAGNDQYTKLLLHFDEDPFTDSSSNEYIITNVGSVTRSGTQSKFGGYSGYFNGSGHLTAPDNVDWNFETGDFTIDMWIYPTSAVGSQILYAQGESYNDVFNFFINGNGSIQAGREKPSGNYPVWMQSATGVITFNAWNHAAFVRYGTDWRIYVAGTSVAFDTASYDFSDISSPAQIGTEFQGAFRYTGYMDEFRISKGIARWESGFTPPTEPYSIPPTPTTEIGGATLKNVEFK
ncbi:MAG: LamG domain-containing protein [Anaerolineales bacterium]|nr:LamG domain-containing protein [Anaerolineales bacterium]